MKASQASALITAIALWANHREDIRALALVGAWARGNPGPASDIDLLLLTDHAADYRAGPAWLGEIDFENRGYHIHLSRTADYGAVFSWHLLLHPAAELELSFASLNWAATNPMDAGTRRVITDGMQILFDKDGLLAKALAASRKPGSEGMIRAVEHHPAATWPEDAAVGSITLDFDNRHRRRIRLTTDRGLAVLLDLPKAVAMAHGDGLKLEGGGWLRINAAPEGLVEVTAEDATQLARIAWHIGNRHFPAQILDRAIRIRPDHVIEAMIVGLGGSLRRLDAPFQPEGGAYAGQAMHGHAHGAGPHDHGHHGEGHHHHGHDHPHEHGAEHGSEPNHEHAHGHRRHAHDR